jgi:hypothetical protein
MNYNLSCVVSSNIFHYYFKQEEHKLKICSKANQYSLLKNHVYHNAKQAMRKSFCLQLL